MWHAWGSQMPAALAAASEALADPSLAKAAVKDAAVFTPTLLTAGGPDNGWFPTPTDRVQIAYGVDSRVQSLLAVADATGSRGFADLAAIQAAWFFGANRSAAQMYDPATGVGYDGLQPDGSVNRNSGAESTIHALLTMIALDSRPELAERAASVATVDEVDGLRSVQAEAAVATNGTVSTPVNWTGESSWAGDALTLARGQSATFDIGTDDVRRWVEPVVWSTEGAKSISTWRSGKLPTGVLVEKGPAQGISPTSGVLLPRSLQLPVLGDRARLTVGVRSGELTLDALLVLPVISRLELSGDGGVTQLVHSSAKLHADGSRGRRGVRDDRLRLQREGRARSHAERRGRILREASPVGLRRRDRLTAPCGAQGTAVTPCRRRSSATRAVRRPPRPRRRARPCVCTSLKRQAVCPWAERP